MVARIGFFMKNENPLKNLENAGKNGVLRSLFHTF
jgi:hypothetical protein